MIRIIEDKDINDIVEIYQYYVENTAITFEYDAPMYDEFKSRIDNIIMKYPFLVYEYNNTVIGYAYATPLKGRKAFDHSVETSIYVHKDYRKAGIGKKLYEALEKALALCNITNLYACIAYPNEIDETLDKSSVYFHEKLGYKNVGEFHNCGFKFNRWYHIVWMEKVIGEHKNVKDVKNFCDVRMELK